MATYAPHLFNLKKLKDNPSVDNGIFICPSLIGVPEKDYKNNGDVYMTNKKALYGVLEFVKEDVKKNKEESLITLNDLDDDKLPEESNKVDIALLPMSPSYGNTEYDKNNNTYTCNCFLERCAIKHNDICVNSCSITCVAISNSVHNYVVAWGNGYNYENHEVAKADLTAGMDNIGNIYVKTSITKNNDNDEHALFTSIEQTPWNYNGLSKNIYITVYFTVNKGYGDETELNTQQTNLKHDVAADATEDVVKYDGMVKFVYNFDETKNIYTGNSMEFYPVLG